VTNLPRVSNMDFLLKCSFLFLSLTFLSTSGVHVPCKQITKPDGSISFDCRSAVPAPDLTIEKRYVLWLEANNGVPDESVDIRIPNYKIDVTKLEGKNPKGNARTVVKIQRPTETFSVVVRKSEPCEKFKNCTAIPSGDLSQDLDNTLFQTKRVTSADAKKVSDTSASPVIKSIDVGADKNVSDDSTPSDIQLQDESILQSGQQTNQLSYNAELVSEKSGQSALAPAVILTILVSYCVVL